MSSRGTGECPSSRYVNDLNNGELCFFLFHLILYIIVDTSEALNRNMGNMNDLAGIGRGLLRARIFAIENLLPLLLLFLAWFLSSSSDWDAQS